MDRDRLLDFSGRTRKPQMALAEQFGFKDYATPAGGCCFLTDKAYSEKLVDMWQHRGSRDYQLDDIMLLKVGRHLRPREHFKLIVAREEGEGKFLAGYRNQFVHLQSRSHAGPLVLLDGDLKEGDIELAARIAARYGQGRDAAQVEMEVGWPDGRTRALQVRPMAPEDIAAEWHV